MPTTQRYDWRWLETRRCAARTDGGEINRELYGLVVDLTLADHFPGGKEGPAEID